MQPQQHYYAVLEDEKTIIDKPSLELLISTPVTKKYLFRETPTIGLNNTRYVYTAIDHVDNPKAIELPHFTVVNIGSEGFATSGGGAYRDVLIKSKLTSDLRQIRLRYNPMLYTKFLTTSLIPLLKQLEVVSSWEMFDRYNEFDELKKSNTNLREELSKLKEDFRKLKIELEEAKKSAA